mmetsp:Transcript_37868/g.83003  ORF Transcript_37868/g.83003 Transcript_37868/m.83003 type:complete len:164 (+) Transcript_37868:129-620(+)|eukprot:CAMPEP_0178691334 /NCGR_PEP_ID=MMETSP0699-20121125/6559_1 /TAXON_ID=265572 /ORGANISM="Extubocellulus spinifer, Strain CCMP396" /LENGTH=163 /DNA_ID=CAMNT_0020336543 /DNA_START=206 /DNA_END=697 /DNA_ORIENTATION=+
MKLYLRPATVAAALFLCAVTTEAKDYDCTDERACRCSSSRPCRLETIDDMSFRECQRECDDDDDCEGFEWTNNSDKTDTEDRCEIHERNGGNLSHSSQDRDDTTCCWVDETADSAEETEDSDEETEDSDDNGNDPKGGKRVRRLFQTGKTAKRARTQGYLRQI